MNHSKQIINEFNIFYAVAWSIGLHIVFIGFFPSMKFEIPAKFEKLNEKIRLNITKKPEIATTQAREIKPPETQRIKLPEPKIIKPQKISTNQLISAATMKSSSFSPTNIRKIIPVNVQVPNSQFSSRRVNISNLNSKVFVEDIRAHKSANKVLPDTNRMAFIVNSDSYSSTPSVSTLQLKPKRRSPETIISKSMEGPVGRILTKTYYVKTFIPELRHVEEIAEEGLEELWNEYSNLVRMKISNTKIYPEIARENNQEGKAILVFKLGENGNIISVSIGDSSGHQVLDRAAIKAVKDAAPYPKIPGKLNRKYVLLKLPISFVLN